MGVKIIATDELKLNDSPGVFLLPIVWDGTCSPLQGYPHY